MGNLENRKPEEIEAMEDVIEAVSALDFGASPALPWCRDSFPRLDSAIKRLEKIREYKKVRSKIDE